MLAIMFGSLASPVRAADPDVVSPLTSYVYLDTLAAPPSQPNVASPLVSYLYQDSIATPPDQPNVISSLVSYLYQDSLATPPGQPNVVSPLVSYLYYDWLGDENLTFQNSPLVSYLYYEWPGTVGVSNQPNNKASSISATPSSVPANGQTPVTVTVTLRDAIGLPVAGKTVQFGSHNSSVNFAKKTATSDSNGQATVTATATTPGSATFYAVDLTDSVAVQQTAIVQFTSGLVSLDPALSNAIVQLATEATTDLPYIGNLAIHQGGCGDYFQQNITADELNRITIGVSFIAGAALAAIQYDPNEVGFTSTKEMFQKMFTESIKSLGTDISFGATTGSFDDMLQTIAGQPNGLSVMGQTAANNCANFQQGVFTKESGLLGGVVPSSTTYTAAYIQDLQSRQQANHALKMIQIAQDSLIVGLRANSEYNHTDFNGLLFKTVNISGAVIGVMGTPAASLAIDEGLNAAESLYDAQQNEQNISAGRAAYNTTLATELSCFDGVTELYANTISGFDAIAQGQAPNLATGQILGVSTLLTGPLLSISSSWFELPSLAFASRITSGSSVVTLNNSSLQPATFILYAVYNHTFNFSYLGINVASATFPLVLTARTNLTGGQVAQVNLNYFDSTKGGLSGAMPDIGSQATVYVLAANGNNTRNIYNVGQTSTTFTWQSSGLFGFNGTAKPKGGSNNGANSTNTFAFEDPIKIYVVQNPSNQTYQAQITVANPFAIPLLATVTQPLPSGITILNTDGTLGISTIVWTNTIPTNGLVTDSFTFALPVTPGAQTNLPVPTVIFSDTTGTNSLSLSANAANFTGLLPIQVRGFVPNGVSGQSAAMPISLTNLTASIQIGTVAITVKDSTGNVVTNFSQLFSLNGTNGTILNFSLPGTWTPGSYLATGCVNINGGTEQVLAGVYVVPVAPIILGFSSSMSSGTNPANLMLSGPVSSNYLVEASTNLINWTPIATFSTTNSPFYFTDTDATNYSQRFYRALLLGTGYVAPSNSVSIAFGAAQPLSTNGFQLILNAPISSTVAIQTSTNLVNWQTLTQFVVENSPIYFTDPQATNYSQRFYRAVVQ
ncbi:MAG TPA: Ig-like domain-containing protein [Candidatus Limnocylindrales bacterium]|nr:Ig-like domain-containing protein [Candidatus Limnocylindrales bacterium]